MDDTLFHARMTAIAEDFAREAFADSLAAAQSLRADLVRSAQLPGSHHGPDEGMQLGWARFYAIKCLFALGDHRAVVDLLATPEPVPFTLGAKNAGWVHSVGAECAMHCGEIDRLLEWGERAYEFRKVLVDDPMSLFHCVHTVLQLLEAADAPEHNRIWAERLIAIGREHGAERPVIAAVRWLCDNVERTGDPEARQAAEGARPDLEACAGGEFAGEAAAALARLNAASSAA